MIERKVNQCDMQNLRKFRETNDFTIPQCETVNLSWFTKHSVEISEILSHVFDKNFVKVTVLLNT